MGSEDEANDPFQFPVVLGTHSKEFIRIIDGIKHLDIVCSHKVMDDIAVWIETKTSSDK